MSMGRLQGCLMAVLIGCSGLLSMPLNASGLFFTLRPGTVFARQPGYEASHRLDLKPDDVIVEGPALEQNASFCLYRLLDRQARPLTPDRAWIPCHSIDQLFSTP